MKVILVKDVARMGRKGTVHEVPDGHALNFLIPRKFAIIATPEGMKRINEEHKKHDEHKETAQKSFEEAVTQLKTKNIVCAVEANEKGHLFKGINADDIAKLLAENNFAIGKKHIMLEHPIKDVGIHEIALEHGTQKGVCRLEVVSK